MYIKFFRNRSGGSKGSVNYLLNEKRVNDGTAKVLKGNADFTKSIIGEIKNKQKVTVGSINLSKGEVLTTAQKEQIISDFEKTLCPGMSEDQYNILWVEHTDKGRLELNFVIPKIELTTQKAFNPYFHKVDFSRIDMFEDIQNIKYNLQSKKDPANAQTLQGEKKDINLIKDYQELDNTLHELVQSRDIQSREHLIALLNENNIKVTRTNKEGISIKLPDSKKAKRFKGSIYNEQFTSITELEAISEATDRRIKEFQSRDTSKELEQTSKRLNKYNEQKARHNREKYQLKDERYKRAEQEPIQSKDINNSNNINNDNNRSSRTALSKAYSNISTTNTNKVDSTKRDEISRKQREIYKKPRSTVQQRQDNSIHQDRRIDYDIRRGTLKRIRQRAATQQRTYTEARHSRVKLYQSITKQSKNLRTELEQNSIKLSREYATVTKQSGELIKGARNIIQLSNELNKTTTARERITNTIKQFIDGVREFKTKLQEQFQLVTQQSENITITKNIKRK